jgi:hypothetical protein
MSKENCLELYFVGDEWMLFDEKNTHKIHKSMLFQWLQNKCHKESEIEAKIVFQKREKAKLSN